MVKRYGSQFQLMMSARNQKATIIRFKADGTDAGLYIHGFRNQETGTSLAARGSVDALESLVHDLRS